MTDAAITWLACERAWLGGHLAHDVLLGIRDGVITHVVEGGERGSSHGTPSRDGVGPPVDAVAVERVRGMVVPGLVSAHGHAFHRLLRGRTQPSARSAATTTTTTATAARAATTATTATTATRATDVPSFWTWRDRMYDVAADLDPDSLFAVARAAYGEMALAGITTVGEFHYLHHGPGGQAYDDPNAMGHALVAAATEVGVRLTLLDTLYLTGRVGASVAAPDLDPVQQRFSDTDPARWAERVAGLEESALVRLGAAVHSVRAVPPPGIEVAAELVRTGMAGVLHAHVAEQREEVDAAWAVHGRTPVQLLADGGALSDRFTAVHGVWLDDADRTLLADAGATVCACPTTERDLADGIVDGRALAEAGIPLALGCDQHAVVDLFEEARTLELHQRLATGTRGHHDPVELLDAATRGGAASLGWPEAGRLTVGAPADLAVVDTDSVHLAGSDDDHPAALVFAATAADVRATMVAGRWVVRDRRHVTRDVVADLRAVMGSVRTAPVRRPPPPTATAAPGTSTGQATSPPSRAVGHE